MQKHQKTIFDNENASASVFSNILEGKVGGTTETMAILMMGVAASACITPWAGMINSLPTPISLAVKSLLAFGAGLSAMNLGRSQLESYRRKFFLKSTCDIESSDPDTPAFSEPGLLFGYCTDTGEPLYLTDDEICRHLFIEGQTGVGKTVLMKLLMFQQIQRVSEKGTKGGLLFIDGKLDADNIQELYEFACYCGRKQDFLVINPGQPELSNTYNPILYGDADEVSSRIMNLVPSTSNNAGADHYRQSAEQALSAFIGGLKEAKLDYNFLSLAMLTMNEPALESLLMYVQQSGPDSMARKNLAMFLDQYSKESIMDGDPQNIHVDLKKLKDILGGIGSRMHRFGTGDFGKVLNSFTPDVVLYDAIREGKIVYIALPTMGKDMAAENLGKITVADLKTAISWLQLNKDQRPEIPFLVFMDENNSYAIEQQAIMWEQARSARISLATGVQTDSGFNKISPEFNERIKANCETKIFFRLSSTDTADVAAEMVGMTKRVLTSEATSETQSNSAQYLQVGPGKNSSSGATNQDSEREQEEHYISPDKFKGLDSGECIILRGRKVWNIRVPLIFLSKEIKKAIGPVVINRRRAVKKIMQGADKPNRNFDPMSHIDKYLEQSRAKRITKKKNGPKQEKANEDQSTPRNEESMELPD